MSSLKLFTFIILFVFSLMGAYLFAMDCVMIERSLELQIKIKKFCQDNRRYPSKIEFNRFFKTNTIAKDWYYFPSNNLSLASYQYPMMFPIPWAPGKSKLSEFIPVIYANAVINPCGF